MPVSLTHPICESKYLLLAEKADEAILVLQKGRVVFHNSKTIDMFGFSGEDLYADFIFDKLLATDDNKDKYEDLKFALATNTYSGVCHLYLQKKTGNRIWCELHANSVTWDGHASVLCFIQDVSFLYRLEDQLRQAHKMGVLGILAHGFAHDFKNILYAIMGFTEITLDETPQYSASYDNLEQIVSLI
ncbi:MAG: PAS domain S-box protein [Pseudomonadota bacterium]